jgi:glucosamine--fructose-6-phosphate aminotransferase (isomerizing)
MREVLRQDDAIAAIAKALAPQRRYWALVGNGTNRIAAAEVRIKLSELCYKSIACDATEDKKHIDLSSEPLILVCAAGLTGSTADDVQKEVAIYQAHKACPIVIATAGETRFTAAAATITVPAVHGSLAFVLSTMAGHLFGYRCALAIDGLALQLRRARGAVEDVASDPQRRGDVLRHLQPLLRPHWQEFRKDLLLGRYDGALEARTAARVTSLCNYALGLMPLDSFAVEFGKAGTPGGVVDALIEELTVAIDQLTRPVDAIKHQAKTVTVGAPRSWPAHRATTSSTATCARWRASTPRCARCSARRVTASTATSRRAPRWSRSSTRRASPRRSVRARRRTRSCAAPSTWSRWRSSAWSRAAATTTAP